MGDAPRPGAITPEEIDRRFLYPTYDGRVGLIRSSARDLAFEMQRQCPQGRELSLAITSLEEALMWALAALDRTTNPMGQ